MHPAADGFPRTPYRRALIPPDLDAALAPAKISERLGISAPMVFKWRTRYQGRGLAGLADPKPHRLQTFKISNDPHFAEKVVDVVGLYMNPPENAAVLSVDEKTQIQALDRTQPQLPQRPGQIERSTPPELDLHVILDNSSTHKTAEAQAWLAKHPRITLHFTPTSASWLNAVERWIARVGRARTAAANI